MPVSEIVSKVGEKGLSDWHSMNWIIDIAERYLIIQFVTSEHTLEELRKYEATVEGNDRLQTALQLFEWWNDFKRTNPWNEDFENSSLRARAWLSSGVFDFLRDSNDRKLIAAAVAAHCSIFLTMDYKTILPHRRRIESITNIRVLRPSQYWKEIRPFV